MHLGINKTILNETPKSSVKANCIMREVSCMKPRNQRRSAVSIIQRYERLCVTESVIQSYPSLLVSQTPPPPMKTACMQSKQ